MSWYDIKQSDGEKYLFIATASRFTLAWSSSTWDGLSIDQIELFDI